MARTVGVIHNIGEPCLRIVVRNYNVVLVNGNGLLFVVWLIPSIVWHSPSLYHWILYDQLESRSDVIAGTRGDDPSSGLLLFTRGYKCILWLYVTW